VLLKLIVGLQLPDSGSIFLDGQDISELDRGELNRVRRKIGFLFQQAALYDSLTVEQNVEFPLKQHTQLTSSERKSRVRELLASVGMKHGIDKLPAQLSGGMQKRVGLARALALDPAILLLDEPTAGLDPITSVEIGELIRDLQQRRTVTSLVVTHDVLGAKTFSNRMVLMDTGEIVADGTFEELRASRNGFVVRFLGASSGEN
jgi:phospholipid/cholesterol/gamma-HCH transport system ATP-binding protein